MGTPQYSFKRKRSNLKKEIRTQNRIVNPFQDRIQKRLFRKELLNLFKTGLLVGVPFAIGGAIDYFTNQPGGTYDLVERVLTDAEYYLGSDPESNIPRIFTPEYYTLLFSAGIGTYTLSKLGSWRLNSIASTRYAKKNLIMGDVYGVAHNSEKTEYGQYYRLTGDSWKEWKKAQKRYFNVLSEWAKIEKVALLSKDHNLQVKKKDPKRISTKTYIRPTLEEMISGLSQRKDMEEIQVPGGKRTRVSFGLPQQANQPKMYFEGYVYYDKPPKDEFLGFEVLLKKLDKKRWVVGSIGPKRPMPPLDPRAIGLAKEIRRDILKPLYYSHPPEGALRIAMLFEGTYPTARGGVGSVAQNMIRDLNKTHFGGRKPFWEIIPEQGFTGPYKTMLAYNPFPNTHVNQPIMLFGHTKNPALRVKKRISGNPLFHPKESREGTRGHRSRELKRLIEDMERAINESKIKLFYDVSDRMQFFTDDEVLRSPETFEVLHKLYHKEKDKEKISFRDYQYYWRDLRQGPVSVIKSEKIDADVYYALLTGTSGLYAALAKREFEKKGRKVPILLTEHGIYNEDRLIDFVNSSYPSFIVKKWKKALDFYSNISYQSADHITTLCQSNVDKMERDGARDIEIIPGGISIDDKAETYDDPGLHDPKSFTIGMLGNVQPVKRVELFIRVAKYLKNEYDMVNWNFHVMGQDDINVEDYVDMIHTTVEKSLELENIFHFSPYGGQFGKTFREAFAPLDCGLLTSSSEVLPISIMEFMSLGKPAVACDIGGIDGLIEGKGYDNYGPAGILLRTDNTDNQVKSFADAILTLYLRKCDKLGYNPGIDPPDQTQLTDLINQDIEKVGPKRIKKRFSTVVLNPVYADRIMAGVEPI